MFAISKDIEYRIDLFILNNKTCILNNTLQIKIIKKKYYDCY
jgi:hypothetical protein